MIDLLNHIGTLFVKINEKHRIYAVKLLKQFQYIYKTKAYEF